MAISMHDAWRESIVQTPPTPQIEVSAKQVDIKEESNNVIEYQRLLIDQIQELRKEDTQRCTMYIVIACILFACMFMYIERLQNRLKDVVGSVRQIHFQNEQMIPMQRAELSRWRN